MVWMVNDGSWTCGALEVGLGTTYPGVGGVMIGDLVGVVVVVVGNLNGLLLECACVGVGGCWSMYSWMTSWGSRSGMSSE